jgi:hypothetical protein
MLFANILKSTKGENYIDLEFDTISRAEALLAAMRVVWGRIRGTFMKKPLVRIVEVMDTREY